MPQTTDYDVVYKGKRLADHFDISNGEVIVGTILNPSANQDANIPLYVLGSQNSYFGLNVVNYGTGGTTTADMVVVANQATASASGTYADFGINGSAWNDANYAVFDANAGYAYAQASNMYLSAGAGGTVFLSAGGFSSKQFIGLSVDNNQNVAMGTGAVGSAGTAGFLYIRGGAGAPTGTPQAKTGLVPMYYDTTNNNFYIYAGGSWKKASTGGTWA